MYVCVCVCVDSVFYRSGSLPVLRNTIRTRVTTTLLFLEEETSSVDLQHGLVNLSRTLLLSNTCTWKASYAAFLEFQAALRGVMWHTLGVFTFTPHGHFTDILHTDQWVRTWCPTGVWNKTTSFFLSEEETCLLSVFVCVFETFFVPHPELWEDIFCLLFVHCRCEFPVVLLVDFYLYSWWTGHSVLVSPALLYSGVLFPSGSGHVSLDSHAHDDRLSDSVFSLEAVNQRHCLIY